ncbi:hypothetical protein N7478_009333 [Penicillium angulare]|uniref:uncharacterized protein n=1 Tax=Penicillium angulare TaxID=116970 RepID=UPI00253FF569|nr:uncharacterized protein N7478_009333 [Penicillium angulare]KAJ5266525.1 hypothetical protein N7478_009333 [Penicillium angulare]
MPAKVSSHLSEDRKTKIETLRKRSINLSRQFVNSPSSRSVSDFLDEKSMIFNCDIEYIQNGTTELQVVRKHGLYELEFGNAMQSFPDGWATIQRELNLPKERPHKSTLTTLARNVSGFKLPPSATEESKFMDEAYLCVTSVAGLIVGYKK